MAIDEKLWSKAKEWALRVEFLTDSRELFLYASALYSAFVWGEDIDKQRQSIKKKDSSIKE